MTTYIVGDGTSWYNEVGRVHDSHEWQAMRDIRRAEVRSAIVAYIAASKIAGRREMMRELLTVIEVDDTAMFQATKLLRHRPSQGLFAGVQAILVEHAESERDTGA